MLFACLVKIFKGSNFAILPFLMEALFSAYTPLTLGTGRFKTFVMMLLNRIYPAKDKNMLNLRYDAIENCS